MLFEVKKILPNLTSSTLDKVLQYDGVFTVLTINKCTKILPLVTNNINLKELKAQKHVEHFQF